MNKILILGGYGNFGSLISRALARANIPITIAGRNKDKAEKLARKIKEQFHDASIEIAIFDINIELAKHLELIKPFIVINTCGPFQNANYYVAKTCIAHKSNYIDLADGRDYVNGIIKLDQQAKEANVLVVSGASTVPALSSAVLEKYKDEFLVIDSLIFGISPGQKTKRGLATSEAVLSYVGKPLKKFAGSGDKIYGWQDLYCQIYPEIGTRLMANCDVPDLDLLPKYYNIKSIRFSAGMESKILHILIWIISWLIRLGLNLDLPKYARFLLKLSNVFNYTGTSNGGMHMIIKGKDKSGNIYERKWFIIAKNNDGPNIPTIASIIIAKKLIAGKLKTRGSMPCIAMVTLDEYMEELKSYNIYQI